MKHYRLFLLLLILAFPFISIAQQTTSLDARRIGVEDTLQTRIESALTKMISPKDFIVIVNVEMGEEKIVYSEGERGGRALTMPGVPEKTKVGEKVNTVEEQSIYKYFITNVFVTLTIDNAIPDEKVEDMRQLVIKLIGLKFSRGDTIDINRTDMLFVKPVDEQAVEIVPMSLWNKLVESGDIIWIVPMGIALVMIAIFLFGPLRKFFTQVITILPSLKSRTVEDRSGGNINVSTAGGGAGPSGGFGGGAGESVVTFKSGKNSPTHPFSFVTRHNLNNLFLLIKEKTPEQVAAVLHYLDPELSSVLLSKLDPKVRAQILITIPRERQFSPEEVDSLDNEIRQNINYLIGGMDMLIGIYESADKETQEQMMQILSEHRPDVVEKIHARTVSFDDLFKLDKSSLRMVLREIPLRSLAISLKMSSEELKERILDILPEGMSEILKEEIEFSQAVSQTKIDEEQRKIIQLVRRLNDEGRISLKPGGESSGAVVPEPAASAPKKAGMPYRPESSAKNPEPSSGAPAGRSTPSAKPESSSIARLLADRKLRMKKKK